MPPSLFICGELREVKGLIWETKVCPLLKGLFSTGAKTCPALNFLFCKMFMKIGFSPQGVEFSCEHVCVCESEREEREREKLR
jgi:hypothetical protein